MKAELLSQTPAKLSFVLRNSSVGLANALRRAVEEIPILAIDIVEIIKNDSALYDEVLAHRAGLIPLRSAKNFIEPERCSCKGKGCAKCTATLTLRAKGPCTVYAKDFKSRPKAVESVYPDMPLVMLAKDQELEVVAEARLGKGSQHAKFTPGLIYYTYYPLIKVNNESKKFDQFKNRYPPQIFKGGKIDKELVLKLDLVDACAGVCDDIIKVGYDSNSFIFTIESWGQLTARELFMAAIDALDDNLSQLGKEVARLK